MSSKIEDCEEPSQTPAPDGVFLPKEVRIKYFPNMTTKFSYDVLPLFELEDYKKKIMREVSFLENPKYAAKWKKFKEGWPESARNLKPLGLESGRVPIFANCRRQKVPPEYHAAFIGPSTPGAVFRRSK